MGKIAFVFSGQGAQYPGMGKAFYEASPAAKAVFDTAEAIRPGTIAQCFSGTPEELTVTENTQPCLFCTDLAAAMATQEAGIHADMAAGFSLGELAALTFGGAFRTAEGFSLVWKRGAFMQEAACRFDSAMVAVVKLPNETVEAICKHYTHVYPVNYNCPGQLVVAGLRSELPAFTEEIRAARGKAIPLPVGGGFHSPFMKDAAARFSEALAGAAMQPLRLPVYSNVTASPYCEDPAGLLASQIQSPVRWQESIEAMIAAGADTFLELGPGKTLCGLIHKISKAVRCFPVENPETLAAAIAEVKTDA